MFNDKGYIVIPIIVIGAILMITTLVIFQSHMNRLIVNAAIDTSQAFFSAEDKIQLSMYLDKYLENEIVPRLKHYLEYESLENYARGNTIILDREDINDEDKNNKVDIDIYQEGEGIKAELETFSRYRGIKKTVTGVFNIIDPFYEMGLPILPTETLSKEGLSDYQKFYKNLSKNIKAQDNVDGITSIEEEGIEKVILEYNEKLGTNIAKFFTTAQSIPSKERFITDDIFLILRQKKMLNPKLELKNSIEGIVYVEGDVVLYDDVNFHGIMVVKDGKISVKGERASIDGLLILDSYTDDIKTFERFIDINYDKNLIYKYGLFLPGFINPRLIQIKVADL